MTDYNDKAQRIVKLGIGSFLPAKENIGGKLLYVRAADEWIIDNNEMTAEQFCNDWRVVGALMEKCKAKGYQIFIEDDDVVAIHSEWKNEYPVTSAAQNSSLREAIGDACLDALEGE